MHFFHDNDFDEFDLVGQFIRKQHRANLTKLGIIELDCPKCYNAFSVRISQFNVVFKKDWIHSLALDNTCVSCKFPILIQHPHNIILPI